MTVRAEAPTVDVQNARQVATFAGEDIRELPTTRNIRSILTLTPGLTTTGLGADCVGGVGVWCNNNIYNLSAHTATNDTEGGAQGRVMVDGTNINTGGGAGIMGMTGGYVADVANAQEVSVQIPARSANRKPAARRSTSSRAPAAIASVATTSSATRRAIQHRWDCATARCSRGRGSGRTTAAIPRSQRLSADPRPRHVHGVRRADQERSVVVLLGGACLAERRVEPPEERIWDNKNSGVWGANYQADRSSGPLQLMNMTRNANVRLTYQATHGTSSTSSGMRG